jgi:hypothetical protein
MMHLLQPSVLRRRRVARHVLDTNEYMREQPVSHDLPYTALVLAAHDKSLGEGRELVIEGRTLSCTVLAVSTYTARRSAGPARA